MNGEVTNFSYKTKDQEKKKKNFFHNNLEKFFATTASNFLISHPGSDICMGSELMTYVCLTARVTTFENHASWCLITIGFKGIYKDL